MKKEAVNYLIRLFVCLCASCSLIACSQLQSTKNSFPNITTPITTQTQDTKTINPKTIHKLVTSKQVNFATATGFTWLPDGRGVLLANNRELNFFQLTSNKSFTSVANIQVNNPIMLRVSQLSKKIAWITTDNFLHLWDTEKKVELPLIGDKSTPITGIAFSQVEPKIAKASYNKAISIWEVDLHKQLIAWDTPSWLVELSFSPDGGKIAGVDLEGFSIFLYKVATGEEVQKIRWSESASAVLYDALLSPDWSKIAWVSRGIVQIASVSDGAVGPLLTHEDYISDVAWAPNSQVLATAAAAIVDGQFSPVVQLWDVQTGKLLKTMVQQAGVIELEFSPDGYELAILLSDGVLQIWAIE